MSKNIQPDQRGKWPSRFFILSIMALTGFEYFYRGKTLIIPLFLFSALYFLRKRFEFNDKLLFIIVPFILLSLVQTILGYNQNILTSIFLLLSFLIYFFIATITGTKFINVFIEIVFVLCLISLVFFSLTYSTPFMAFINKVSPTFTPLGFSTQDIQGPFKESRNIIIYNFKDYAFLYNRNSGPFWEPGMFAIFINVALYFNLIITKRLFSIMNIVFSLTIITTLSTTGYIAFIFTLFVYSLFYSKSKLSLIYLLLLVIASLYIANLDFMRSKIEAQYSDKNGVSRFGAMFVHYQVITEYPITGVGDGASRFIADVTDADSTANGITFVFVKYGIFLGLFYYCLLYRACVNIMSRYSTNKFIGYGFLILLIILAFSQDITIRHFYLFLIVWGVITMAPQKRFLKNLALKQ